MVEYYNFNQVIWQVIKKGQDKLGVTNLRLVLREFDRSKLDLKNGSYPELKTKMWLLYVGNAFDVKENKLENAWENRLAYVPAEVSVHFQEELEDYIRRQIKERVKEKFGGNKQLEDFCNFL